MITKIKDKTYKEIMNLINFNNITSIACLSVNYTQYNLCLDNIPA